ncbi:MAG: hypothetical protein Q9217_005668 [Psora testacea]
MSLLKQAAKQISNQDAHKSLNAFISHFNNQDLPLRLSQQQEQQLKDVENGRKPSLIEGRLIAVKDNICSSEFPTTCASSLLEGFHSPYAATVVNRLKAAGALIAGTTNLDEFGMGSDSLHSHFGPVNGSYYLEGCGVSAGGSSGGSAVAVASGQCYAALGTDTGGSVRLPAAYNGIVGFKPSYGMVSRFGVIAYANSLDTVGVMANCVSSTRKVFEVINGHDSQDPSSMDLRTRQSVANRLIKHVREKRRDDGNLRIGVPTEYSTQELQPAVREAWIRTLQGLQGKGHSIHAVTLPATKMALSAYYVLAPAEASSNLAKYDGARYGNKSARLHNMRDVLFSATRGQGLGKEVKRRILLGAYTLSAGAIDNYFIQAQRVRRLVQGDFNNVFAFAHPLMDYVEENDPENQKVDIIVAPTVQSLPPKLSEIQQRDKVDAYSADVLTVPASLAGLPAINVPVPIPEMLRPSETNLHTIGIQVVGQYGTDARVFNVGKYIEELYGKANVDPLAATKPNGTMEAPENLAL